MYSCYYEPTIVVHDEETGGIAAYLQCMIIDTRDGQYKDIIKAVPMDKAADSSTGDTVTITSDVRKDIEVIQGYIEQDPLKQLYSIHGDSKYQKSKQFYLDTIEIFFQEVYDCWWRYVCVCM